MKPQDPRRQPNRRRFLQVGASLAMAATLARDEEVVPPPTSQPAWVKQRYRVGVCDWMLLKRQKLGAFKWAATCGIDGVEVDMGGLGKNPDLSNELRKPEMLRQFLETSRATGVGICSLALSCFYAQSIAEHPRGDDFLAEMVELGVKLGTVVGFLPMGVQVNLEDAETRRRIVERLRRVSPVAENAGFTIGIETSLDAAGNLKLLDEIGGRGVGIYYNFATAMDAGRDLDQELRALGQRICQVHCTDRDGQWLEHGRIDLKRVRTTLDDIGWRGWLVLERSRVQGKTVEQNFSANARYLKRIFQDA